MQKNGQFLSVANQISNNRKLTNTTQHDDIFGNLI